MLFDKSHNLLRLILRALGLLITQLPSHNQNQYAKDCSNKTFAIVSVLLSMYKDIKMQRIISSFREDVDGILQNIVHLQV